MDTPGIGVGFLRGFLPAKQIHQTEQDGDLGISHLCFLSIKKLEIRSSRYDVAGSLGAAIVVIGLV
jgi:hypothetical protein